MRAFNPIVIRREFFPFGCKIQVVLLKNLPVFQWNAFPVTTNKDGDRVRFVRTAQIAGGQAQPVLAFAQEIGLIIKSEFGVEVKIYMQAGGPGGLICWEANHENLGADQKIMGQSLSDQDDSKKVTEAQGLFIEGSVRDSLWVPM